MPGRPDSRSSSRANTPTQHDNNAADKNIPSKRSYSPSAPASADKKLKSSEKSTNATVAKTFSNGGRKKRGTTPTLDDRSNNNGEESSPKSIPEEIVSQYIKLEPINKSAVESIYPPLSENEQKVLEKYLDISSSDPWRDDWVGNLAFADKEITSPESKSRDQGPRKSLVDWALANPKSKITRKILYNLLRYVYNLEETPEEAKTLLHNIDTTDVEAVHKAIRRINYDPVVLRADGWTTKRAREPMGASGGAYRIGDRVIWDGWEAVIIAFLHDDELGDLWKAMWLDDPYVSFDLELEELEDARRKYERRQKKQAGGSASKKEKQSGSSEKSDSRRSARYASSADFTVKGIENGIILAVSYSKGSRAGVFWPARVVHASEMGSYASSNKRASAQMKVDVMFLAPYWNTASATSGLPLSYAESVKRHGSSIFDTGPLLEHESIDASEECIQPYPYSADEGLDIDQLRVSFKFSGLPKAAFPRFVNAHRLALGLKTYAQNELKSTTSDLEKTTAGLFEAHPLAVHTAMFPAAVLHLPFGDILQQMPLPSEHSDSITSYGDEKIDPEPVLCLSYILEAMKPPNCWGIKDGGAKSSANNNNTPPPATFQSPPIPSSTTDEGDGLEITIDSFMVDLSALTEVMSDPQRSAVSDFLNSSINMLLGLLPKHPDLFNNSPEEARASKAKEIVSCWTLVKMQGAEIIGSTFKDNSRVLVEWRRLCERLYKYLTLSASTKGYGNGVSSVITDPLCNQHITSSGCFERPVRLPATIKAAKDLGAGFTDSLQLVSSVGHRYIDLAESKVVSKAHSKSYLKRIKKRCMIMPHQAEVVPLTENSEGDGGEDTMGSRGTWMAALAGVGAAIKGIDMIMRGECVNAFCATRPPGHHAGRELHPMKAVSNGFCILNTVACAALYATTPVSENGAGLKRVCVIDIDVHHGNGTQDILCSTYDPRFLYVSIHAGGPDVNGIAPSELGEDLGHHLGRNASKGIFPGRCGDTSPHDGVLNIPLGARVTAHALGTALITKVTPRVEQFAPDLIIISAGFDAHKNDPLNLGGLDAEDFGTLTEVICQLAHKSCSGRVLSVLEGGYGVPCCRIPDNLFDPEAARARQTEIDNKEQLTPSQLENNCAPTIGSESDSSKLEENTSNLNAHPTEPEPVEQNELGTVAKEDPNDTLEQFKQLELMQLGDNLPEDMKDNISLGLARRLDKCRSEGFMDCVRAHIRTLVKCNKRN